MGSLGLFEERTPVFEALFDAAFSAVLGGVVVAASFGQIGLGDIGAFEVVGVLVARVAEGLSSRVMTVPQVFWHGKRETLFDILSCGEDSGVSPVAFRGGGEVHCGVGERNLRLWHSHKFDGLLGGDGQR